MTSDDSILPPSSNADQTEGSQRAQEAEELLAAVQKLVVSFIRAADEDVSGTPDNFDPECSIKSARSALLNPQSSQDLQRLLGFSLPEQGLGKDGVIRMADKTLQHSVNTWHQGFLDKLYASTTPAGLASDLILSSLNTNAHIYHVSPALTVIEKHTATTLASMFGLTGPYAGGVSQPGGSAANHSSLVIARNVLFPETKTEGNGLKRFVLFTSAHGHYSVEKAAQMLGLGTRAVKTVAVDAQGRMSPSALESAIRLAREAGETPFYVNATAGTTVLGSFDPLEAIASICKAHELWLHVDGSWGGSVVFSNAQKHKLSGIEAADSISICPHKMLGVPLTCSFLLGKDLREFHRAMTLPAAYLFHNSDDSVDNSSSSNETEKETPSTNNNDGTAPETPNVDEFWDLADLTPQCGRRSDSLKLALTWIYTGTSGFRAYIDNAFATAAHLTQLLASKPDFTLVSTNPPPCLQVCFYYRKSDDRRENEARTAGVVKALVAKGYMTDFAPGEDGAFLRVVVNGLTTRGTVEGLVSAVEEVGREMRLGE